jgi:hypothetical protein
MALWQIRCRGDQLIPRLGEPQIALRQIAHRQKSRNVDFAEKFEDLKIWQRSRALANEVYDAME